MFLKSVLVFRDACPSVASFKKLFDAAEISGLAVIEYICCNQMRPRLTKSISSYNIGLGHRFQESVKDRF